MMTSRPPVDHDHKELAKFIADKLPQVDINPKGHYQKGRTPLHIAAAKGHLEMCKIIIDKVSDINPRDDDNKTPFLTAVKNGHKELARFIAGKLQDKNQKDDRDCAPLE